MKIQVLVAAMNQGDHALVDRMNLQTDAIIGNQCDRNSIEKFDHNGHEICFLNFAERGVGLNRNNALMRADGDIILFADDDMVYVDGYDKIIAEAFGKYRDADVIVFNLKEAHTERKMIDKPGRVGYLNYLRYGTARMAARLPSVKKHGIYFNQCFGGGTGHSHGEDNLFLNACLKNGLKVYAIPAVIAELTETRQSSWNNGYNDKYLFDQGVLYRTLSRRYWRLLCLQDAVRRYKSYQMSPMQAYSAMVRGAKSF